jgi:protein phosphatase
MGTTATVALIKDSKIYIGHVGDSRLYILRGGFLYQCTLDHSLVSMQVREGIITEEAAETHQLRNVITRSVGYQEREEVDISVHDLEQGDKILICSDGLHGKVGAVDLAHSMQEPTQETCNRLIELAKEGGGEDNITVALGQMIA